MKKLCTLLMFVFVAFQMVAQNITQLEYFIDSDPGVGNATSESITATPALQNFTFGVPVTSLSTGLHFLYVRVKNANGKWSVTSSRPFVKVASVPTISRIEYFIDNDPGYGNATSIDVPQVAGSDVVFDVPLTSVTEGLHTFFVRAKDVDGRWSTMASRSFLKIKPRPNVTYIEYYVDNDPGLGNGTSVAFTPATVVADLTFPIDVSSLAQGNHKLYVRAKNSDNQWSKVSNQTFSVCNTPAPIATDATQVGSTGFKANWQAVSGATSYELAVSSDDFVTAVKTTATTTSANVTNLKPNVLYKYRVTAVGVCTSANSNIISVTTLDKQTQTIQFAEIGAKTLGSAPFALTATASSGLAVSYVAGNNKITISGTNVTIVSAGRTSITASQSGGEGFSAAEPVVRSFCINPAKPKITAQGRNTAAIVLTSSAASGNQWYKDGAIMTGVTGVSITVNEPGHVYKVVSKVDECSSEFSDDVPIVVSALEPQLTSGIILYPNPVEHQLLLSGLREFTSAQLSDMMGKQYPVDLKLIESVHGADVSHLSPGLYLLQVNINHESKFFKFIKK